MGHSRPWIGYQSASKQLSDKDWCKRHGRTLRSDETDGDSYFKRGVALLALGFVSYEEYLSSELWASIKLAAYQFYGKNCLICKKPAKCIHHLDYAIVTLKGYNLKSLIPICNQCHNRVEFDGDRKRSVREVRKVTLALLPRRAANILPCIDDHSRGGQSLSVVKPLIVGESDTCGSDSLPPSRSCERWNDPIAFRRARECVAALLPRIAHMLGGW